MLAVTRTTYGPPTVLTVKTVEKPIPKDNELLIRVYATTINRTDCGILRGKPFLIRAFTGLFKPSSLVPGTDFAGRIEAVGKNVTSFKVGDRIWGLNDEGLASQAEYMVIREKKAIAPIPDHISYEEVVACAEGAHYAYNFITKVKINAATKVMLNGATGGIGSAALQLLKYYGATVTAVGNTKNIALLTSLGADSTIDYQKEDFTTDGEKYHFVFDAVGKSTFAKCERLLMPKGVYISSELGPNSQNLYLPFITKIKGKKRVIFPLPSNCKRSILLVTKLLEQGKFRAVIDRTYSIHDIAEAYRYVEKGEKTGNVILSLK